jgi:hypothetical protein
MGPILVRHLAATPWMLRPIALNLNARIGSANYRGESTHYRGESTHSSQYQASPSHDLIIDPKAGSRSRGRR